MEEILELNILVYDKEEYSIVSSATKYYNAKKLFFSNIKKLREKLPEIVKNIEDSDEEIINIFAIRHVLNVSGDINENGYIFFDKEGNVKSEISREEIEESKYRDIKTKYKEGDFVFVVNRTYKYGEHDIEFGIISSTPDKKLGSNYYNILIGTDIHNHCHELEEFLYPYNEEINYEMFVDTIKNRLDKIGY